ncbi:DnaB-like helicase C-terminal domain-containing protein [Natribacillus halophilus]|uniref:DNA 5'-3' helicase n=1 Tax=Natribacillus halophilus TaxID=549003 RepID=A0A1G8RUG2_9BACI|nr:DnaB-like helicase C-terminal domain-containing protein [Natribacillus halophilus]SDJ20607.1 Replicative DNA helicase [Natribacillus halophilus]
MNNKEPINERAEIAVLGAMMNDERSRYDIISRINTDHFTTDERRAIFERIGYMTDGRRLTAKMVKDQTTETKERRLVETADGAYVDYDHFKRDIEELVENYKLRKMYHIMSHGLKQVGANTSVDEISDKVSEGLSELIVTDTNRYIVSPEERYSETRMELSERIKNPEISYGLKFSHEEPGRTIGFPSVDQSILGAKPGDLILVGAETGIGKTALGVNIARLFSVYQDHIGYYANTEMDIQELEARLIAPIAGVTVREFMSGQFEGTGEEIMRKEQRAFNAISDYGDSGLMLSRIPSLNVPKIKALLNQVRMKKKQLDYVVIDYIQRMDSTDHYDAEHLKLKKIAMRLKEMAVQYNIPVIALAQRNFEGYVEGGKAIRNECDAVFYIEPVKDDDIDYMHKAIQEPSKQKLANYKIVKNKVRRDDNPYPIYVNFDKKRQFINEIM